MMTPKYAVGDRIKVRWDSFKNIQKFFGRVDWVRTGVVESLVMKNGVFAGGYEVLHDNGERFAWTASELFAEHLMYTDTEYIEAKQHYVTLCEALAEQEAALAATGLTPREVKARFREEQVEIRRIRDMLTEYERLNNG